MLKDLLGVTLQELLEAELEDELGYSKYDYANKETGNHRNGYSKKNVISSMGEIELNVPRDRKGEFDPQVVKKLQTDISSIEDQVLSMYAKGMTTRDISTHLENVYGVEASAAIISKMIPITSLFAVKFDTNGYVHPFFDNCIVLTDAVMDGIHRPSHISGIKVCSAILLQ